MNIPISPNIRALYANGDVSKSADEISNLAFANAANHDYDGGFPAAEISSLHRGGLLTAPLPTDLGGCEPNGKTLAGWLRRIGSGSLALGRLYEGHVNALDLVGRYGDRSQILRLAAEARAGALLGVWNTDDCDGLILVGERGGLRLHGRKILASGAGHIRRPLVTATDANGRRLMVTPLLDGANRADLSGWTAHGMRASATGTVDFSGISVTDEDIVGEDGDYERQPFFSAGAWRFCAVQQGGMAKLFELLCDHLTRTGRGADPHQAARLGEAGVEVETAWLWVERAAAAAHGSAPIADPERVVAYVNLTRFAVERAALALMELVQRSVGLQSFIRPNPLERVSRDLSTYLRQPGPDRALTAASAWVLSQKEKALDLWT